MDVDTGRRISDSSITALAVSANGKRALVGGSPGTIRLYSISR
jgi:WD40 repeat protein